jgi:hypothetical protein
MKKVWMAMTAALVLPAAVWAAEEAGATATLDVPVLSAYVWRGQVLNDEAVVQPSLTVSKGGFAINIWENFNLTDAVTGDANEFSEYDFGLSYSTTCPFTGAAVSLGLVDYTFPNQTILTAEGNSALVADTREAYVTLGFGECPLAPTLWISYDFKEADGFYANLAVSHSFELAKDKASLALGASVGAGSSDYNAFYFGVEDDALNDANVSLSVPVTITPNLTITPGVSYTMLLDSEIEDAAAALYKDDNIVVGSIKASYAF